MDYHEKPSATQNKFLKDLTVFLLWLPVKQALQLRSPTQKGFGIVELTSLQACFICFGVLREKLVINCFASHPTHSGVGKNTPSRTQTKTIIYSPSVLLEQCSMFDCILDCKQHHELLPCI